MTIHFHTPFRLTFLFLLLFNSIVVSAQEIKMYKSFGGVVFEMDTLTLSMKQVMTLLNARNAAAYQEFKKAKANLDVSSVMGFTGGALIAFPLGTAVAGGEPEWGLAAGGAALILGSIPIYRSFRGRAIQALDIYNGTSSRLKPKFQFRGNGISVIWKI